MFSVTREQASDIEIQRFADFKFSFNVERLIWMF